MDALAAGPALLSGSAAIVAISSPSFVDHRARTDPRVDHSTALSIPSSRPGGKFGPEQCWQARQRSPGKQVRITTRQASLGVRALINHDRRSASTRPCSFLARRTPAAPRGGPSSARMDVIDTGRRSIVRVSRRSNAGRTERDGEKMHGPLGRDYLVGGTRTRAAISYALSVITNPAATPA